MGLFEDDDLFGKKDKPYSPFDKLGGNAEAMTAINKHRAGDFSSGLSIGQQITADEEAKYQDAFNRYREAAAMIGKPRISPEQAIILTKKDEARKIAPQSLMIKTGVCYKVDHKAHWET